MSLSEGGGGVTTAANASKETTQLPVGSHHHNDNNNQEDRNAVVSMVAETVMITSAAATVNHHHHEEEDEQKEPQEDPMLLQANPAMCYACFDVLFEKLQLFPPKISSTHRCSVKAPRHGDTAVPNHANQPEKAPSSTTTTTTTTSRSSSSCSTTDDDPHNDCVIDFVHTLSDPEVSCPIFVTWEKRRRQQERTRHHHHQYRNHRGGTNSRRKLATTNAAVTNNNTDNNDNNDFEQRQVESYEYDLRGCIGTLSPKPLAAWLREYAMLSAFRDRRFVPLSVSEVPLLRVKVSLLVQYESCRHVHDWVVGLHGIIIQWGGCKKRNSISAANNNSNNDTNRDSFLYSATYLPEVAPQQNWDQKTAVASLIQKAGYHGRVTADLLQQIECIRYQTSKCDVTYDDYVCSRGYDPIQLEHIISNGGHSQASSSSHHHHHRYDRSNSDDPATTTTTTRTTSSSLGERSDDNHTNDSAIMSSSGNCIIT